MCGFRGVVGEQASALVRIDVAVGGVVLPRNTLPNGVPYVESVVGKPYTVTVHNVSQQPLGVHLLVDGVGVVPELCRVLPGSSHCFDAFVTSRRYDADGVRTEAKSSLQFAEVALVPRGGAAAVRGVCACK